MYSCSRYSCSGLVISLNKNNWLVFSVCHCPKVIITFNSTYIIIKYVLFYYSLCLAFWSNFLRWRPLLITFFIKDMWKIFIAIHIYIILVGLPMPCKCQPPPTPHNYKFKSFGVSAFLATLKSCFIWQRCTEYLSLSR